MLPNIFPSRSMRFCIMESVSILREEETILSIALRSARDIFAGFCPQETSITYIIRYHTKVAVLCLRLYIGEDYWFFVQI